MTRKTKDAKALLELQKTLSDLASWKLVTVQNKRAALEKTQTDLIDALGRYDSSSSALIPMISKKLRDVNLDLSNATLELDAQSRQATTHGARTKMAERVHQRLEYAERSKAERKALMDLIERQQSATKSSSA
jgi:hypothetical protein